MRKLLIAATAVGLMAIAAPAFADEAGTGETSNNVDCTTNGPRDLKQALPDDGNVVSAKGTPSVPPSGSLVVCNDGSGAVKAPIQGRVIVHGDGGGAWVAADGDKDNADQAKGWVRLNVGASPSVKCGGPTDAGTSTNAESNNGTQAACG